MMEVDQSQECQTCQQCDWDSEDCDAKCEPCWSGYEKCDPCYDEYGACNDCWMDFEQAMMAGGEKETDYDTDADEWDEYEEKLLSQKSSTKKKGFMAKTAPTAKSCKHAAKLLFKREAKNKDPEIASFAKKMLTQMKNQEEGVEPCDPDNKSEPCDPDKNRALVVAEPCDPDKNRAIESRALQYLHSLKKYGKVDVSKLTSAFAKTRRNFNKKVAHAKKVSEKNVKHKLLRNDGTYKLGKVSQMSKNGKIRKSQLKLFNYRFKRDFTKALTRKEKAPKKQ